MTQNKVLNVLKDLQPDNGGFLEATPLTAFVVMSLAGSGNSEHDVTKKGIDFLVESMREDGSWPIDTDLASWVTTMSIDALAAGGGIKNLLSPAERQQLLKWLLRSQHRSIHPYTHAEPGGWAWTDLPGAVPDADDTSSVLVGLKHLDCIDEQVLNAVKMGINWLLDLQNSDGGIPTFCRGWSNLPFDRSTPDITSNALAAMSIWRQLLPVDMQQRVNKAITRGIGYLKSIQCDNGSWIPLWFGNQFTSGRKNPVYGTAKVVSNLLKMPDEYCDITNDIVEKAIRWLVSVQNSDSGWGGDKRIRSTIEETALAVNALAAFLLNMQKAGINSLVSESPQSIQKATSGAVSWLISTTDSGKAVEPSPIGLYFARLWYSERLYPMVFYLSALNNVQKLNN